MSKRHQAARWYAKQGWHVFPCRSKGKEPACEHGVKDATTDFAQIDRWWKENPDYNIAVACGRKSGVYVVDVDLNEAKGIDGFKSMQEFPPLPDTVSQFTPGGGNHGFFQTDNPPANKNAFRPGVDIRGEGYYVVVAPSVHPNGGQYAWMPGRAPHEHALAEYPDFLRPAPRPAPAAVPTIQGPWTAPQPPLALPRDDLLGRASPYLAECEPAVQGQGGHDKLLWAAVAMVRGFQLSDAQAYDLLAREYNPRCIPPWDLSNPKDEKDFRRKISEARKIDNKKPDGWLLLDDSYGPVGGTQCVVDLEAIRRNAHARQGTDASSSVDREQAAEKDKVEFLAMTAAELIDTKFTICYLAERILVAGQPCILAGAKKTLKTSISADLAISLATAGHFLGKFRVPHAASVAIMSGESGMATLQETISRICKAAGIDPHTLTNLYITDRIPRLDDPAHLRALAVFLAKYGIKVLIIDPTYLAMPGADAGNLFVQGERLRGVSEVCAAHKVTLILVHHIRKNIANPFAIPELDDIAWAGFAEFARQWILLGRRELYVPGTGEHRLWLTAGGSAGHSGAWGVDISEGSREDEGGRIWETTVQSASGVYAAEKERHNREKALAERTARDDRSKRIWTWLCKRPDGATQTQIRDGIGISSRLASEAIEDLIESENIKPHKIAACNGRKYDGYVAVQETKPPKGPPIESDESAIRTAGQSVRVNLSGCPDAHFAHTGTALYVVEAVRSRCVRLIWCVSGCVRVNSERGESGIPRS